MGAVASMFHGTAMTEATATVNCGTEQTLSNPEYATSMNDLSLEIVRRISNIEGFDQALFCGGGRESFLNFLRNEYAEEIAWFFIAMEKISAANSSSDQDFYRKSRCLITTYLSSSSCHTAVSDKLRQTLADLLIFEGALTNELSENLFVMRDQSMAIVAMGAIPRYLSSHYYKDWSLAHLKVVRDSSKLSELEGQTEEIAAEHTTKFGMKEASSELDRVLMSSIWLREMLVAIENLPLCVSVASASNKMRGFPLIYVNTAFETTTGYRRDEIIGQNCRFLQSHGLEVPIGQDENISKISHSLKEAQPIKIALTNYRKDGTSFHNLLAMKPIMDENGEYAFVLGIQVDLGDNYVSARKLKLIDDLFKFLPNTVIACLDPANFT